MRFYPANILVLEHQFEKFEINILILRNSFYIILFFGNKLNILLKHTEGKGF
ncbi:hypothetical protein SiH_0332 [Sulfolobus islandicus HVE10/4]|uniref:Uncharacterized protein n=1 Tax=Saccharolobus islandicus (strain HVE10/4) TaxID=930943 RepID=F0NJB2_SACI0|nr:hypothetical protein SiH_0332 [Sulfolobus islandicus HVE10/4]